MRCSEIALGQQAVPVLDPASSWQLNTPWSRHHEVKPFAAVPETDEALMIRHVYFNRLREGLVVYTGGRPRYNVLRAFCTDRRIRAMADRLIRGLKKPPR